MAKTPATYKLSEEDIIEIFRRWINDAEITNPDGKPDPSPVVNASVFIEYARQITVK